MKADSQNPDLSKAIRSPSFLILCPQRQVFGKMKDFRFQENRIEVFLPQTREFQPFKVMGVGTLLEREALSPLRQIHRQHIQPQDILILHVLCHLKYHADPDVRGRIVRIKELGAMGLELPDFSTADELRAAIRSAAVFGKEKHAL